MGTQRVSVSWLCKRLLGSTSKSGQPLGGSEKTMFETKEERELFIKSSANYCRWTASSADERHTCYMPTTWRVQHKVVGGGRDHWVNITNQEYCSTTLKIKLSQACSYAVTFYQTIYPNFICPIKQLFKDYVRN